MLGTAHLLISTEPGWHKGPELCKGTVTHLLRKHCHFGAHHALYHLLSFLCELFYHAIALILCPGLSHEQCGFWVGYHHLRKCNSPGTFVVFLDTDLLAKQDMETRCEPCGCTSYLSTSLPAASWHERAC